MHDFLLAKEIVDEVKKIAEEKKISKVSRILIEIGQIALAHDGHEEHVEDVSIENLEFGIENIAKGTVLESAELNIKKIDGDYWKISEIEGE